MKTLKLIGIVAASIVGLTLFVVFVDGMSTTPRYVLESATIHHVEPDAKGLGGFPGESERTLAKFQDGLTIYVAGRRGEPGERILLHRQRGTNTVFGLLARNE